MINIVPSFVSIRNAFIYGIKAHSLYSYQVFFPDCFFQAVSVYIMPVISCQLSSGHSRPPQIPVMLPVSFLFITGVCIIIYILEALRGLTVAWDLVTLRGVQTCSPQMLELYTPRSCPWRVVLCEACRQSLFGLSPFSPKEKGRENHACEISAEHSSHPRWNVCSSILIPPSQHRSIMVLPSITTVQLPQSVS